MWSARVAVIGRGARFRGSREGEVSCRGLGGTHWIRGNFSIEVRPEVGFGG